MADEELARADTYALLARLFYAAPDAELHARLRAAPTDAAAPGAFLASSWRALVDAARRLERDEIADEYEALFMGLGKPELFLYASHHLAGALNETPLVALRDTLRELGLTRAAAVAETEDHIACLCEVMRALIVDAAPSDAGLAAQRRFFDRHLRPWAGALGEQIAAHPRADFYRALGLFARDFFAVEAQAFDLMDIG